MTPPSNQMDQYLDQLIEDLGEIVQQVPPPGAIWSGVDMTNPNETEDIAHVEQSQNGESKPLSKIVGVEKIVLPPVERLTDAQADLLCTAMVSVLSVYHFIPDFPVGLPAKLKYKVLRDHWDQEQVAVTGGAVHIALCDCVTSACPFPPEFCDCLVVEREEQEGNERNFDEDDDIELPF